MAEPENRLNWDLLLGRIREHRCMPFLGAGACYGVLPLGREIAEEWAKDCGYPLEDSHDLARVAQYLAVVNDPMWPKGRVIERLRGAAPPDFDEPDEPHAVLAGLPLPVYMTTNYDDFLVRALRHRHRDPRQEICRWNENVKHYRSVFDDSSGFEPTPANPVVFHLHGHLGVEDSIVLTEDDYLDLLVKLGQQQLLPPPIEAAMKGSSLLFLGYRLADWDFRVLYRSLVGYLSGNLRRLHVSVQIEPEGPMSPEQRRQAREYLESYFRELKVQIYWGTCRQFVAELRRRWEAGGGG